MEYQEDWLLHTLGSLCHKNLQLKQPMKYQKTGQYWPSGHSGPRIICSKSIKIFLKYVYSWYFLHVIIFHLIKYQIFGH